MNYENLHELINRYEANLDATMGPVHREQFKWEAMKLFRDVWFSENASQLPFADMFNQARKGCGWMVDNSRINPTSGVVKMAQAEPDTVERLFKELLFAEDNGDLSLRQSHMDDFVDQIETLRLKLFPRHWKYKHDRHAASCYRSFFTPDQDYVYRFSDADLMARYIGFEKPLGSGQYFSLPAYYEMCDIIVDALKQHPTLLGSHQERLNDKCYRDDSLHLMAFDFMYCCRTYGYYHGLTQFGPIKKGNKASQQKASNDQKRQQLIDDINEAQNQLLTLQTQLADYEIVSLIGTDVSTPQYGRGVVIEQEENKIGVQFGEVVKTFMIHKQFAMRPKFEDEEQIVDLLSNRADILRQIDKVTKQIVRDTASIDALS